MLGNSINIKSFDWNPVVRKNFAKTSQNYHFLAQLVQKMGPHGPRPKCFSILCDAFLLKKASHKLGTYIYIFLPSK